MKYSVFHVEGGLGKNIAATAVARCIKNNYPDRDLIVVCSYPEVFLHNPIVEKVYALGNTPYFYKDYIKDKDTYLFKHEPYFTNDHIQKKKSLIENWCSLYNIAYNNEKPELFIPKRISDFVKFKYSRQKPIMLIQSNGGMLKGQTYNYAWTRDMPIDLVEKVVLRFSQNYHIMQVCRNEFNVLKGFPIEPIFDKMSNLELLSLLLLSKKRLLIDSCLQHAAMALNLPSTVLWIGTSPKLFGYDLHDNIIANPPKNEPKLINSYLFDYNFEGILHESPYMEGEDLFSVEKIINSLI